MIKKLVLAAAIACGPAHAEFYSGNELLQLMDDESYSGKGIAMGFVAGVADSWLSSVICPPPGTTLGQHVDIAKKFLRDNPQHRHLTAESLVRAALARSWPCKKGSGT